MLIEVHYSRKVSGLLFRCNHNVFADGIYIQVQNGLLYYSQPFHCPPSIECLEVNRHVEYTNGNEGIMPDSDNFWVQNSDFDLHNPIQSGIASTPKLYYSWTPSIQSFQFLMHLSTRYIILTVYKRCKMTQQWILCSQAQEYAMVFPIQYKDQNGWADCVDLFTRVVKQANWILIISVGASFGPVHSL